MKEVTCQILLNQTFVSMLDSKEAHIITSEIVPTDNFRKLKLENCLQTYLTKISQLYLQRLDHLPRSITVILINSEEIGQLHAQISSFLSINLGYAALDSNHA